MGTGHRLGVAPIWQITAGVSLEVLNKWRGFGPLGLVDVLGLDSQNQSPTKPSPTLLCLLRPFPRLLIRRSPLVWKLKPSQCKQYAPTLNIFGFWAPSFRGAFALVQASDAQCTHAWSRTALGLCTFHFEALFDRRWPAESVAKCRLV